MNRKILWPLIAVLVVGLIAIFYPRRAPEPPVPLELPEPASDAAPDASELVDPPPEPEPGFVTEGPAGPEPLPTLDESDEEAQAALKEATSEELVNEHLVTDSIVRKIVTTVDNLPLDTIWMKSRAVPQIDGRFRVEGSGEETYLSKENYARYSPFVQLIENIDTATLADQYERHYPLLQEAYQELGYPGRQFHNRAIEVIDHLLATPDVQGRVRLVQPHVFYKFADPRLESLSAGQKTLIRIGPENAAIIRSKLIELRAELERRSEAPDDE